MAAATFFLFTDFIFQKLESVFEFSELPFVMLSKPDELFYGDLILISQETHCGGQIDF